MEIKPSERVVETKKMKTIKLYNHYSEFYPTTTPYGKSSYINPLADPTFNWTASAQEENMLSELDVVFGRVQMIETLNSIIDGNLCFYHSQYRFEYLDEKVKVTIYYKGHRYLSSQEKVNKGYDPEKRVGAAGSLSLTQTIEFKGTQDEAGDWTLIVEDEPAIELAEFIDGKKQPYQDVLFGLLYEKYNLDTKCMVNANS